MPPPKMTPIPHTRPWGWTPSDRWVLACASVIGLAALSYQAWRTSSLAADALPWEKYEPTDWRLDINGAELPELMLLPGVSPRLAARIVEYRDQSPFRGPDDLEGVAGIGPKLARRLTPHLTGWQPSTSEPIPRPRVSTDARAAHDPRRDRERQAWPSN